MKFFVITAAVLTAVASFASFAFESSEPVKGTISSRATVIENALAAAEK